MRINSEQYFNAYVESLSLNLDDSFQNIVREFQEINLDFRIKTSAVYSSNIEGNSVDVSSFMNSEIAQESFKPKNEIEEIKDLVSAYQFAISNKLNEENILSAHNTLSNTLLIKDKRGKYRTDRMGVYDNSGLVYLAVEPNKIRTELRTFFEDLASILDQNLSIEQVFYHASLIHLKFAQIHPFWDGNGRTSRLIEKWFLAKKLGIEAWNIQSEFFYKSNITDYYQNINLGMDYYSLDYSKSVPFLQMLALSTQIME